ncbi:AMP-binding protein [Caballeronia choica]|uniref:AMP-binding protein n=1 Tax=Caballeronia choica TaxID=326476 RepID=UPI001F318857|nr:AMP-binding protein [Caballeronia choica]
MTSESEPTAGGIENKNLRTLSEMFDAACMRYPDRPAFTSFNRTLTFSEAGRYVHRFSAFLLDEIKLNAQDRVALILPNGLPYVVAFYGALRAGLTVVNVNPFATPREIQVQLDTTRVGAIVVLENFAYKLDDIVDRNKVQGVVSVAAGDLLPIPTRVGIDFLQRVVRDSIPPTKLDLRAFRTVLSHTPNLERSRPSAGLDDVALLQYTGGTTGTPKCAMLTHRNLSANVEQIRGWLGEEFCSGPQTIVTPLPLFHVFALTASLLTFVALGGHNVLVTDPRKLRALVKTLEHARPTALIGVNSLFDAMLRERHIGSIDWSCMRLVIGGGAAIQAPVAQRWLAKTGTVIIEGYGLTEASPVVCANPVNAKGFSGSVGYPLPATEISIRGDDSAAVAPGETGEVWVRGPQVMRGYWMNPDETARVLSFEGWLRTGDMGYLASNQTLVLVDRIKDVIIVSGFKVFPSEVEAVACACPGVDNAAAVGIPDERTGQAVKLSVVRSAGDVTADAVLKFCRANLSIYKVPRFIEFRDSLPTNQLGKTLRRALG